MATQLLLPNRYKKIGWIILIPATIMGIILCSTGFDDYQINAKVFAIFSDGLLSNFHSFKLVTTNITNTVIGVLFIAGALTVSFSKEKNEDEYIAELRLSSLLWAVCVSYILLLMAFLFVYGTPFLNVMVYNMFTVLIIFIVRFNYTLYKNSKTVADEK
jgi:small-conductance mechanosensitive channel